MISISDQLNLANILTLDPRESNVIYAGGTHVKIETIAEYLTRIDMYSRFLGLEVLILEPSGTYLLNDFVNLINLHNISLKTYKFVNDLNTLELVSNTVGVINSLESDSTTEALSAAKGKELKQLIDNINLEEIDPVFQAWLLATPPAYISDIPTALSELSEDSTHRTVTDAEKTIWENHISSTLNPHNTTASQVGAYSTSQVDTLLSGKQNVLGYTPENVTNKENITLDSSTTKYPTNNLVKTYVDAGVRRLSTGAITMPTIVDNADGTATVGSIQVNIYPNPDFEGNMITATVAQATLTFTDGVEEYVSVRYNGGTPIFYKETVGSTMNHSDILPIFVIWRLGTVIHSLNFDSLGLGLANKTQSAAYHTDLYKLSTDGGLVITEVTSPAARTINVTGAIVYTGVIHQDVDVFSSATDQMTEVINTPSGWTYTDKTVYNNTQRNPGTSLTTISNNKYSVRWFYRSIGDAKQLFYVLGTGEYNSISEASFEQPRTDLPMILKHHCMLIGRAIIQHNATSGSTQSLIQRSYSFSSVINHDDTGNISLAGSGVTYGHINDQAQTLYGVKTFNSSPIVPSATTSGQAVNKGQLDLKVDKTALTSSKYLTGFIDGDNIGVSYNYTNRTITLTGNLTYLWRGEERTLTSPWTSSAHTATVGGWFLYSTDGTNFSWSQTPWQFSDLMTSYVNYGATANNSFALRETHGIMDWESHEEFHNQLGTYRETNGGGEVTAGTYVVNTATDAANSPGFNAAVVKDEDVSTTIPAWIEGTYTTMYVGPGNTSVFNTASTLPFIAPVNTFIQVNNTSTGTMTAGVNARWYNVYQIMMPCASDSDSQKYRMIMLQPQATFTSLAAAQSEDTRTLNLGALTTLSPEFLIYTRITYVTANGDTNAGKCRIATGGISYVVGNRAGQVSITGFTSNNHAALSNLTWAESVHIGTADSLAAFDGSGLASYILLNTVLRTTGDQTIDGIKTFNTSPVFPTLAVDTNTTQAATTAFVINQGYLKSSSYTASDVLTKIKTVDGSGSGLDADLLDGLESSAFQLALTNPVTANSASFTAGYLTKSTGTGVQIQLTGVSVDSSNNMYVPGKLGINVTPTSRLHAVDGTVAELKFNSGASDLTPSLAVGNTGASGKFAGLIAGTSGAVFEYDSAGYFAISSNTKTNYTNGTLGGGTRRLVITSGGAIMIGSSTAPTAWLHIQAGTATASTAPLKFTSGTNLTNPEAGAIEYDGTNLFFTPSSTRKTFKFVEDNTDFTTTLGTNLSYKGTIETGTVGENVAFGDVLYLKFSDGKWWKAKADAYTTTPAVRMALGTINANASGTLLIEGNVRYDTWNFAAAKIYLSAATAGAITSTQPSTTGNQIQVIGIAKTATTLYFKPSLDVGEL